MTNETTKPVVTQAALKLCPKCGGAPYEVPQTCWFSDGLAHRYRGLCRECRYETPGWYATPEEAAAAWNTRAHSPSEQSVVSQDLVPVAWRVMSEHGVTGTFSTLLDAQMAFTGSKATFEPLYPASAIEAAQIAARNEALEEAARVFTDYQKRVKDGGSDTTVMWTAERAAYAIRALRKGSDREGA